MVFEIGKYYAVKWLDSAGTPAGWVDLSEEEYSSDVAELLTVGRVLNKSDKAVVLVQTYTEGNDVVKKEAMGFVTIPIASITESEEIISVLFSSCQPPAKD